MFCNYAFGEIPPVVEGVVGDPNKNWILGIINFYAFMLCLYVVVYYARLEMLEHDKNISLPQNKIVRFFEFVIRFALLGIVALKILSYSALDDLFLFSFVLCLLLSIWLFYMRIFRYANISKFELIPNVIVLLLSLWALFVSSPESQSAFAVQISNFSLLAAIVLASCIFVIASKFGKDFYSVARNFVTNW